MSPGRRMWALGIGPALLLAGIVLPMILFWGKLPNPMAVHWDLGGAPDGAVPPIVLGLGMAGIFIAMWWSVHNAVSRDPREGASFIAGLYFVGGLLGVVLWMSVLANRDISAWRAAGEIGWAHLALVTGVGIGAGFLGWFAAGGRSPRGARSPEGGPVLPIAAGEGIVWSGGARGWVTTVAGLGVVGAGLAQWSWITVALVAVGLIVLVFAEVRLTIGSRGAVVSMGWLGIPWRTIPIESIAGGDVEKVSPISYGGWGYRGRPGVRAIIVRGGEGIRLHRRDKPDLVVTVGDAATGAAVINSMLGIG